MDEEFLARVSGNVAHAPVIMSLEKCVIPIYNFCFGNVGLELDHSILFLLK